MNFGEQIKKMRIDMQLTQDQVANQLCVSRQAISNWENNKNLPDLEMIVHIANFFNISIDQLILGDDNNNLLAEKLIKNGSETRKSKYNMTAITIGAFLLIIGTMCFITKAFSVEYIDSSGYLHENFFLLPIGALFMFSGIITFLIIGLKNLIQKLRVFFSVRTEQQIK